jgi:hypothetical protein
VAADRVPRAPRSAGTPSAPRTRPKQRRSTVPPRSSASSTSGPGSARCRPARTNHRPGWPPPWPPTRPTASGSRRSNRDHRHVRLLRQAPATHCRRPGARPLPHHPGVGPCGPHGRRRPGPPPLPRVGPTATHDPAVTEPAAVARGGAAEHLASPGAQQIGEIARNPGRVARRPLEHRANRRPAWS